MNRTSRLRAHVEAEVERGARSKDEVLCSLPDEIRDLYPDLRALSGAVSSIYAAAQRAAAAGGEPRPVEASKAPARVTSVVLRAAPSDDEELSLWFPDDGEARPLGDAEVLCAFFSDDGPGAIRELRQMEESLSPRPPRRATFPMPDEVFVAGPLSGEVLPPIGGRGPVQPRLGEDRIAALESQVAILEARLAVLEELAADRSQEPPTTGMGRVRARLKRLVSRS